MNSSLRLRPQMVRQVTRLLASSSKNPSNKEKSASLAKKDEIFMVKSLNVSNFLNDIPQETTRQMENVKIEVEASNDITLFNGVPREQIEGRRGRIFKPAKSAMQSATNDTKYWKLEFENRERWENPLMGWGSSGDPLSNLVLQFPTKEDAIKFCEKNGWTYTVDEPQVAKKPRIKSYAANFAWSSRTRTGSK